MEATLLTPRGMSATTECDETSIKLRCFHKSGSWGRILRPAEALARSSTSMADEATLHRWRGRLAAPAVYLWPFQPSTQAPPAVPYPSLAPGPNHRSHRPLYFRTKSYLPVNPVWLSPHLFVLGKQLTAGRSIRSEAHGPYPHRVYIQPSRERRNYACARLCASVRKL